MADFSNASYSHPIHPMTQARSHSQVHSFQNPSCACPDCEYIQWNIGRENRNLPQEQASQRGIPRKYTHNPYALGPIYPPVNGSSPPVVTPGDALARIVPNISEYDVYTNPTFSPPVQATNLGNSIQDQFNQALGAIMDVACTPRGRTMLQTIIRLRHPVQIKQITDELSVSEPAIIRLMLDSNACHVIRTLLEVMDPLYLRVWANPSVMNEAHVLQLATISQHTRRILQTLFERFNREPCCDNIAAILSHHSQYLATTQQGCIALMRVVDNALPTQKNVIHESIFPHIVPLASDPYGNYVIQHAIERGDTNLISNAIMTYFLGNSAHLCCNKFASNVMEKVLYNVTPGARRAVIESMINNPVTLQTIMNDGYGNFVIQAAIDSCTNHQEFRRIAERVRPLVHTSPYGHKIDAKLRNKRMTQALNTSTAVSSATNSACNTAPTTPRNMLPSTQAMYAMHPYLGHNENFMHRN